MKEFNTLILFFLLFALNSLDLQGQTNNTAFFGSKKINLPNIVGMTEGYNTNQVIKQWVNYFNTDDVKVLAYYLPDELYKKFNPQNQMDLYEYIQIHSFKNLKNTDVSNKDLDFLKDEMLKAFERKNWAAVKKNIEDFTEGKKVSLGKPVIIETYSPNKNIRSLVGLIKTAINDGPSFIQVVIYNLIVVQERIIMLSYYADYESENSLDSAKSKNNYAVLLFNDEN